MSFFKSAKTTILAFKEDVASSLTMSKSASVQKVASFYNQDPPQVNDIAEKLKVVAEAYQISANPEDYIYVAVRALTADVPNENHDAFSEKELLRFDTKFGCKVYQTFNMKPHHVNHRSADPKQARGVILDSHYNTKNAEHFPEILIAVDKTKDKKLAEGISSGDISGFSMGCTADWTICSVCNHTASSPAEFCNHIRFSKGKDVNGKVAFEWCEGVCFEEESSVDDPADKNALTQEVILASADSKKDAVHLETELLTINTKLNKVLDKISEKEDNNMAVKKASSEKKAHDSKGPDFEHYKDEKKDKEEKSMSSGEYGVLPDAEDHSKGTENIAGKEEAPKDASKEEPVKEASKEANPYMKVALDSAGKGYWNKFLGDYSTDMTKDIKKKKLSDSSVKKADSGQMFKSLDSKQGNPPADFKIDKKKGNPPAEFKFAQLFKDVEIFPAKKSYLVVTKSKRPIYMVALKDEKANMKQASLNLLKGIVTEGLVGTMKNAEAFKLKSFQPTFKPSLVDEFTGDNRDKKLRTTPTEGMNEDGVIDEGKPNLKGKPRETSLDADGINTVKLSATEESRRKKAMEDLMTMIDKEEAKGTSQQELYTKVDAWVDEWDKSGRPVVTPTQGTGVSEPMVGVASKESKEASSQERALGDLKGHEKSEAKDAVTAKGEDDLAKVKRDDKKGEEIWSAGKDDLDIPRKHVVDLKASKESEKTATDHKEVEINTQNKKDVSDKKWKAIQKASLDKKAEIEKIKVESAKEVSEFKKAFRQRMLRALKLASKRSELNIIDNPLKMHMADVLMGPTEEYIGMDADLATTLIENAFSRDGGSYINHLLKEAETYIDMPEESFLAIEDDARKLNLVLPVADVSDHAGDEFPMSLGEGEEGFLGEEAGPMEPAEDLMARASRNNPVLSPKAEGYSSKHSLLNGIFRK